MKVHAKSAILFVLEATPLRLALGRSAVASTKEEIRSLRSEHFDSVTSYRLLVAHYPVVTPLHFRTRSKVDVIVSIEVILIPYQSVFASFDFITRTTNGIIVSSDNIACTALLELSVEHF